jgi:hypothetical protein
MRATPADRYGIAFAFTTRKRNQSSHGVTTSAQRGDAAMTARIEGRVATEGHQHSQRRQQLRSLLLSAADAARQSRRMTRMAARIARPVGHAVRDRVALLVSAAG